MTQIEPSPSLPPNVPTTAAFEWDRATDAVDDPADGLANGLDGDGETQLTPERRLLCMIVRQLT